MLVSLMAVSHGIVIKGKNPNGRERIRPLTTEAGM